MLTLLASSLPFVPSLSLSLSQLLNKVAGVYGLLGSLSAGGTVGQISYYIYSAASLAAFAFGLKAVSDVSPERDEEEGACNSFCCTSRGGAAVHICMRDGERFLSD